MKANSRAQYPTPTQYCVKEAWKGQSPLLGWPSSLGPRVSSSVGWVWASLCWPQSKTKQGAGALGFSPSSSLTEKCALKAG